MLPGVQPIHYEGKALSFYSRTHFAKHCGRLKCLLFCFVYVIDNVLKRVNNNNSLKKKLQSLPSPTYFYWPPLYIFISPLHHHTFPLTTTVPAQSFINLHCNLTCFYQLCTDSLLHWLPSFWHLYVPKAAALCTLCYRLPSPDCWTLFAIVHSWFGTWLCTRQL